MNINISKRAGFAFIATIMALSPVAVYAAGTVKSENLTAITVDEVQARIIQHVTRLEADVVKGVVSPQERDIARSYNQEYGRWIRANEFGADDKLVRIHGTITGSPIFDDWPEGWTTASQEEFGALYTLATPDGDTQLIASKDAFEEGAVLFAFGTEQAEHAYVIAVDDAASIHLSPKAYATLLKNSPRTLIEGLYFNHVMVRKAYDLFPGVIDNPDGPVVKKSFPAATIDFITNKRNFPIVFGVIIVIALVVAIIMSVIPQAPKAIEKDATNTGAEEDTGAVTEDTDTGAGESGAEEVCPYHNEPLINGECPHGCTITRCAECGAIMKDGKCPSGCKAPEYCPSCGSQVLEDGSCPRGCTIIRCNECGGILQDGICPNGCNADPLHFGWAGATCPDMTDFQLEVVTPEEYAGFAVDVPDYFVVGRSARDARESFLELLVLDNAKKQSCSRRYVEFRLALDGSGFDVSMLKNHNFAYVNNHKISREGDTERLVEGSTIRLNPDFELRLIRKSSAE